MSQHATPKDTDDGGSFVDDTPLVRLLGDHARVRILAFIVGHYNREWNVSEIARNAGLARNTVYDHLDPLVESGAIEAVGGGQANRYRLAETEVGQKLRELEGVTLRALAPEQ
jgi:DNA-binding transcriptional ArsR family regulator